MRTITLALLCLTVMVVAASLAGATPSSIVFIPSTDTVPQGTVHLDVDTLFTVGQGSSNTSTTSIGAVYGATDRLEIGLDYVTHTTNPLVGNLKYKAWNNDEFAVAVGAWLLGDSGTTGANQVYALGSYKCDAGRFALGFAHGDEETLGEDNDQLWVSYDRQLNGKWWVGADFVSGHSPMGSLNLGVGCAVADNVGLILGYDFYNASGINDTVTLQLDANF